MTDKTIRALYLGKIRPWNSKGYKTEKYTEHLDKYIRLYDEIKAVLPSKSRKMLDEMTEEYELAQSEVIIDAFAQGFKIGLSLAAEGLCSGN